MRIRQEETPSAMRAFCANVRLLPFFPTLTTTLHWHTAPELHLRYDDPRYRCPAQRPPLRPRVRRAGSGWAARFSARAERARGRARAAQSAPTRCTVPARRAHRAPTPRGEVCAPGEWLGGAGRRGERVARDGHARGARLGAPRERAVH